MSKKITLPKLLSHLDEFLVDNPVHDDVMVDIMRGNKVSDREKEMAEQLNYIYKAVHAFDKQHKCYDVHQDWRDEVISNINKNI